MDIEYGGVRLKVARAALRVLSIATRAPEMIESCRILWLDFFFTPGPSFLLYYSISIDGMSQEFFPSIGSVASKADDLPDAPASDSNNADPADDERLIQEIESLCMKCHEQASLQNLQCHLA